MIDEVSCIGRWLYMIKIIYGWYWERNRMANHQKLKGLIEGRPNRLDLSGDGEPNARLSNRAIWKNSNMD